MKAQQMDRYYGEILKKAREKAGLTQEELAMRSGLNQNRISRMERGISRLNLTDFVKAMSVLSYEDVKTMLPGEDGLSRYIMSIFEHQITKFQYSNNTPLFTDLFGPLVAYKEGPGGECLYLPARQPAWHYGLRKDSITVSEKSQLDPEATGLLARDLGQLPLPLGVWSETSVDPPR